MAENRLVIGLAEGKIMTMDLQPVATQPGPRSRPSARDRLGRVGYPAFQDKQGAARRLDGRKLHRRQPHFHGL